jgi:hypothetical protein
MATLNEEKNIFVTEQGTVRHWSQIPGDNEIKIQAKSELRRGFNFDVSASESAKYNLIQPLLNKWSKLKLFSYAELNAELQAQLQAPLNLFVEAGLAARLQAMARVAVGFGLSLEMKPNELLNKLKQRPDMEGFLGDLAEIFLEETDLVAELYGEAAVAIMAHMNAVFTGSLIKNKEFEEPGFRFIFDAGIGYLAGGGYRFILDFKFPDTGRMMSRISDLISRGLIHSIEAKANLSDKSLENVHTFELFLRIGMRMAYEIGDELSRKYIVASDTFSPRAASVIVEEGQRWFLQRFMNFGITEFKRLLQGASTSPQAISFLNNLEVLSKEKNITLEKWYETVNTALGISTQIESISSAKAKEWSQTIAMIWSAAYLADIIYKEGTLHKFAGTLKTQPPNEIVAFINTQSNYQPDEPLTEEKLISFLVRNPLNNFLNRQKDGNAVLNLFKNVLSNPKVNVVEALFNYSEGSFGLPKEFLEKFMGSFQGKSKDLLSKVTLIIQQAFPASSGIRNIFEQVLSPAVEMTAEVVLPEIINNFQEFGRTELQEALSAVLLSVLSKTTLQIIDTMLDKVVHSIERLLTEAANTSDKLGINRLLRRLIDKSNLIAFDALIKEGLKVVASNMGPFLLQNKKELFNLLEDILSPVPSGSTREFVSNLKRPDYIPKRKEMERFALLLMRILSNTMLVTSTSMLPKLFNIFLEYLQQILSKLLEEFRNSVKEIENSIYDKVHDTFRDKLAAIFLKLIDTAIDEKTIKFLPPQISLNSVKKELKNNARGVVNALIEETVLSPFKNAFALINFSTDVLLKLLKQNDVIGFQNYVVSTTISQLTKNIGIQKRGFDLSIPISIAGYKKNIKIGSFSRPKNEVMEILSKSLSEVLPTSNFFQKLIPFANNVFKAQDDITNLKIQKNTTVQTFHQGLHLIRNVDFTPRILVSYVGSRGYQPRMELILHYPGLPKYYTGNQWVYPNVLIFLNNKALPIPSFYTPNLREGEIHSEALGLTLSRIIHWDELVYGINTVVTYIPDSNGTYRQFFYSFII